MDRNRKLVLAKTAVILGAIPVLIWAHAAGPDAGKTGVPGESTCNEAGCHVGTALNGGKGSVSVAFPDGLSYSPGTKQHLVVTVSDPTQIRWGFQLTTRTASNSKTQAGSFTSTDQFTAVVCGTANLDANQESFLDFPQSQACPATKPLSYVEHTQAGSSRLQQGSQTYQFDWTPPTSNVGDVTVYVAANAANGDNQNTGDHIYTAKYTLTPAAAGSAPAIQQNGVTSAASFQPGIVPNSWIAIQGTNLAPTTDTWDKAIVGGKLPTTLDNVSVMVGGKPAYVHYVSPTQINVLAPDVGTGSMSVTVTNSGGTSTAVTSTSQTVGPAFFQWVSKYAVATHNDATFSWAVANGTFAGVTTVAAKPGEVIVLWGTGFGPTTPATPVGVQVPANLYSTTNPVTVTVGGIPATVYAAALAPGFAGLYQVAMQIPASAPDGDLPVVATINGAQSPSSTLITVKH
ncbi:MAG TPA: choice-of-anchor V domain-containing protein [Bryobacteraceae bacterium]